MLKLLHLKLPQVILLLHLLHTGYSLEISCIKSVSYLQLKEIHLI